MRCVGVAPGEVGPRTHAYCRARRACSGWGHRCAAACRHGMAQHTLASQKGDASPILPGQASSALDRSSSHELRRTTMRSRHQSHAADNAIGARGCWRGACVHLWYHARCVRHTVCSDVMCGAAAGVSARRGGPPRCSISTGLAQGRAPRHGATRAGADDRRVGKRGRRHPPHHA